MKSDTNKNISERFQRMIMEKSREDRLIMGCSMFHTARELIKYSILNKYPKIRPQMMKEEIFLRFYGSDFSKEEKGQILENLR